MCLRPQGKHWGTSHSSVCSAFTKGDEYSKITAGTVLGTLFTMGGSTDGLKPIPVADTNSSEIVLLVTTWVSSESVPGTSTPRVMEDDVRGKLVLILVPPMELVPGKEKSTPGVCWISLRKL